MNTIEWEVNPNGYLVSIQDIAITKVLEISLGLRVYSTPNGWCSDNCNFVCGTQMPWEANEPEVPFYATEVEAKEAAERFIQKHKG